MKKIGLLILILSYSCSSNTQKTENLENLDKSEDDSTAFELSQEQIGGYTNETDEEPLDWSNFEFILKAEDLETKQKLGFSKVSNEEIEFRLKTENQLCDTEYWGQAKNQFPDSDPEIDEDNCGSAYPALEYVFKNKNYELRIRISLDNDKAKLMYQNKSGIDTDCIPNTNLILRSEIEDESLLVEQRVNQFITAYLASDHELDRRREWIEQNQWLTENFIDRYTQLMQQAYQDDPELGLGFDPILNAQDNPGIQTFPGTIVQSSSHSSGILIIPAPSIKHPHFSLTTLRLTLKSSQFLPDKTTRPVAWS